MKKVHNVYVEDPFHEWFGLSYCSYLVVSRVVLESMPVEWQNKMIKLINECAEKRKDFVQDKYVVQVRDDKGRFSNDPLRNYRHPPKEIIEIQRDEGLIE